MNPPEDVFDAEGRIYPERRHHSRRASDYDPELVDGIERGFARWVRLMFLHRGKIMTVVGLLGGMGGFLVGYVGRLHDLDALTARVVRLEIGTARTADDVGKLKAAARIQNYILCVSVPRSAPSDAHAVCQPIIDQGISP